MTISDHYRFRSFSVTAFALLVLLLPAAVALAGFKEGKAAIKKKDYATAAREFHAAAESGDPKAQLALALLYDKGLGVGKDLAKSFLWASRAAEQGNSDAELMVATALAYGIGTKKDLAKSFFWASRAAEQGNSDAELMVATALAYGRGTKEDPARAEKLFRKHLPTATPEIKGMLGTLLMYRPGKEAEGHGLLLSAAEGGEKSAYAMLFYNYLHGRGTKKDPNKALEWIERGVKAGAPEPQYLLCQAKIDTKKYEQGADLCILAAKQRHAKAAGKICDLYEAGLGLEKSDFAAYGWCTMAGEMGSAAHAKRAGELYGKLPTKLKNEAPVLLRGLREKLSLPAR